MEVWVLTDNEVEYLATVTAAALRSGSAIRVAWDGGLKIKLAQQAWSAPLGAPERQR